MINLLYDNLETKNLPSAKGMADHDNTRELFKSFSYPYTCTLTLEARKDLTYFYSICPEQYKTCLSVTGEHERTIISQFTPEILNLLKDEEYKVYLLVYFPYEGFSLEYDNGVIIKFFNYLIDNLSIPKEKILFVYGDLKIKENIDNYFIKLKLPKENILGLNVFEHIAERDSRSTNFRHPESIIKPLKSKKFLYLNAAARSHRMYLIGALQAKGLLDQFHYSWLNRANAKLSRDQMMGLFKYFSVDENYKNYINGYTYIDNITPVTIDQTPEDINSRSNQVISLVDLYRDSYCSLVTETQIDEYEVNMMFITEKTYKAIYNFHPFLLVGCHGTLKYLRDRDYETFPELFDESYDDLSVPSHRLNKILEQAELFCNRDETEIKRIYRSDYFVDKLTHNWKNLQKRKGEEDLHSFLNWLNTFVK